VDIQALQFTGKWRSR